MPGGFGGRGGERDNKWIIILFFFLSPMGWKQAATMWSVGNVPSPYEFLNAKEQE